MSQEHQPQSPKPTSEDGTAPETTVSPAGETTPAPVPQEPPAAPAGKDAPPVDKPGNKPVVVYIMILFIAAFLLMALSFFMHQRSNTEVMGELQHSVTAMQEVQAAQEKVIELQEETADLQKELDNTLEENQALKDQAAEAEDRTEALVRQQDALLSLYSLMQEYAAKDYGACQAIIEAMESDQLPEALEEFSFGQGGVTRPADRYQELKAAVEAKLG